MNLDELMRRYAQLRHELSLTYDARPWAPQRIDDLAEKLLDTEREIASACQRRPDGDLSSPMVAC